MTMLTPDHGLRVYHVAGRADQRARHRQRHVAVDLRGHRGRPATRHQRDLQQRLCHARLDALQLLIILVMMVAVVGFIVLVERGERRIPVQYAKRVMGRRMMGGQSTHLPLKVNAGGVIPMIFASSLLAFRKRSAVPGCEEHAF